MKQRAPDGGGRSSGGGGGGGGEGGGSENRRKPWIRRKRNEQRLGGKGGLSLEAFANAKSKPSGYNPAIIKKQKEFYRNAKFVSKYKKTVKQQSQPRNDTTMISDDKGFDSAEDLPKPSNDKNKKKASKWSLKEEYERKHAEDEKAKMEREAMMQAKREQIEQAEARRKALKKKMFKKTGSGQPRMKFRIEHILESLGENSGK